MYTLNHDVGCITTLDIPLGIILWGRKSSIKQMKLAPLGYGKCHTTQALYYKNLQAPPTSRSPETRGSCERNPRGGPGRRVQGRAARMAD